MPQYGIQAMGMLSVHDHSSLTQGGAVPLGSLTGHNKPPHDALAINADQVDGIDIPSIIANILTNHTKAVHDALGIELLGDKVFINETVNTKMGKGLTIQQDGNNDEILALKSTDVAHGITDFAETDTYASLLKAGTTTGGALFRGATEDAIALYLQAFCTIDNTDKGVTATAPVIIESYKKAGAGLGAQGVNANTFVVKSSGNAVWLVDKDGDTWQPGEVDCASLASLCLGTPTELTINAGAITITRSYHSLDGEGDLDDNLDTINGGYDGQILVLKAETLTRDITVRDAAGNIELEGGVNFILDTLRKKLYLFYDALVAGGKWCEINRFSG